MSEPRVGKNKIDTDRSEHILPIHNATAHIVSLLVLDVKFQQDNLAALPEWRVYRHTDRSDALGRLQFLA